MGKKLTTEEFICRAKKVHGDKYDYSKVDYKASESKVCIICPEHGEFWQEPANHLQGKGCKRCGELTKSMNVEEFLEKAHKIHGNKYDYSKVKYVNNTSKIEIVCPIHGSFFITPINHITNRCGCRKCKTLTQEEFIEKSRLVHGDKYDYSKVKYVNSRNLVTIICPTHGEFQQRPSAHMSGCNCSKCSNRDKVDTNRFIEKARAVHGDKYDYSKVEYKKSSKKVIITCPKHGDFEQTPNSHLMGRGCTKCALEKKCENYSLSKEEFIEKSRAVHGDKYDYSKVEYINYGNLVTIICPTHGEFQQTPNKHLRGQGCSLCYEDKIVNSLEKFLKKAKEIHGEQYSYEKFEYKGNKIKSTIFCKKHQIEFQQSPGKHLSGHGCPICRYEKSSLAKTHTQEYFLEKAKKIWGEKYDYTESEYKKSDEKIKIICHEKDENGVEHGEFWMTPTNHLHKTNPQGCPKCGRNSCAESRRGKTEDFIKMANITHNNKYDYSKVDYKASESKVCIICPEHGEFWQEPANHLQGQGCPFCKQSVMEASMRKFLHQNNIEFIQEYTFDWLVYKRNMRLDFYLPEYNAAIECQGIQHFKETSFRTLEENQSRDKEKLRLCNEHGIKILYFSNCNIKFPYEVFKKKKDLLNEIIKLGKINLNNLEV